MILFKDQKLTFNFKKLKNPQLKVEVFFSAGEGTRTPMPLSTRS